MYLIAGYGVYFWPKWKQFGCQNGEGEQKRFNLIGQNLPFRSELNKGIQGTRTKCCTGTTPQQKVHGSWLAKFRLETQAHGKDMTQRGPLLNKRHTVRDSPNPELGGLMEQGRTWLSAFNLSIPTVQVNYPLMNANQRKMWNSIIFHTISTRHSSSLALICPTKSIWYRLRPKIIISHSSLKKDNK